MQAYRAGRWRKGVRTRRGINSSGIGRCGIRLGRAIERGIFGELVAIFREPCLPLRPRLSRAIRRVAPTRGLIRETGKVPPAARSQCRRSKAQAPPRRGIRTTSHRRQLSRMPLRLRSPWGTLRFGLFRFFSAVKKRQSSLGTARVTDPGRRLHVFVVDKGRSTDQTACA